MTDAQPPAAAREDALAGLRLHPADLRALARQGFVSAEFRGGRGPSYKLRWRRNGRRRVRCLGRDAGRAARVRAELERLRRPLRAARLAARLMAEAHKRLRRAKRLLAARAAAQGYHYHGYAARRRRPRPAKADGADGADGAAGGPEPRPALDT